MVHPSSVAHRFAHRCRKFFSIHFTLFLITLHVVSPDDGIAKSKQTIKCSQCEVIVHPACYGITGKVGSNWLCWVCTDVAAAGRAIPKTEKKSSITLQDKMALYRGVECILCPVKLGAFKKTVDGKGWCHVTCVRWVPEASLLDKNVANVVKPVSIESVPRPSDGTHLAITALARTEHSCVVPSVTVKLFFIHSAVGERRATCVRLTAKNGHTRRSARSTLSQSATRMLLRISSAIPCPHSLNYITSHHSKGNFLEVCNEPSPVGLRRARCLTP